MNRTITNAIRFVMDEFLPPVIRDNRIFMYPFFYLAFKGKNIKRAMNLKSEIWDYTEEDYIKLYQEQESISRSRVTDLNEKSIKFMLERLDPGSKTILDVGCGNGYWLSRLDQSKYDIAGCDIKSNIRYTDCKFYEGHLEHLPFEDNAFDIVTCHHTLEHVIHPQKAVAELKRVAKNQIVVVVPKQRYFYYTLDEHVNFFPISGPLVKLFDLKEYSCDNVWGDWVFIGNPSSGQDA